METLLRSGIIDEGLQEAITEEMKKAIIREWRDDVQKTYNEAGVVVLKGGQTSKSSYIQIRFETALESKAEATERIEEAIEDKDSVWNIPKVLQNVPKITEKLVKIVEE